MTKFDKIIKDKQNERGDQMTNTAFSTDLLYEIAARVFDYDSEDAMWVMELHNAEICGDVTVFTGYIIDLNSYYDDDAALRVMLSKSSLMYEATLNGKVFTGEVVSSGAESGDYGEDI